MAEEVAAALDATDKDVEIGGAGLAAEAIELGLVDELRMFRNPVVVGGGTPYLPPVADSIRAGSGRDPDVRLARDLRALPARPRSVGLTDAPPADAVSRYRPAVVDWTDEVDEILSSDLAAGFAYLTPARGVVITPMAPLALRDRHAGTVTLTTSQGLWKKLDRVRRNPGVAVAYHAREHGLTSRAGFVVVQGRASFPTTPDRAWLESITPEWERFLGPRATGLSGRVLEVYYWQRVPITIQVERVVAYPDDSAAGTPRVLGAPPAQPASAQKPPRGGTAPRIDVGSVVGHAQRLPHTLLGWCGSDEMPEVVPVAAAQTGDSAVRLSIPAGTVPAGGRRAGLTSHQFQPRMIGQEQRVHTGWLESDGSDQVAYSPHTRAGYRLPASRLAFTLGSGSIAFRMRKARELGLAQKPR